MATPLRSLVWKEWHERKWWLALGVAAVGLGVVYAVWDESVYRRHSPVASLFGAFMVFGLFAAVFLAMRTALGEATQGTLGFSSSLPAPLRRQAWVRLGGAIATIVGPICFGAMAMSVLLATGLIGQAEEWVNFGQIRPEFVALHQRHLFSGLEAVKLVWTGALPSMASSVELLLIIALIGARRRAEAHVGFIGAVLAFLWIILPKVALGVNHERPFFGLGGMILPGSLAIANSAYILLSRSLWPHLAVNLLLLTALAVWFTRRYGTQSSASADTRWTWRPPALLSRLPFRWPGQWSALVWLDLRQAAPMALAGLGLALLSTLLETVSNIGLDPDVPMRTVRVLPGHTAIIAILWSAVVGSGVFASECHPRLEQFWRSRPISPSAWFWAKYLCGLAAVLGALDLVPILVSWHSRNAEHSRPMGYAYIACAPVLHAVTYALAVLGVCWLRRPVLCGIAAILSFFVSEIVLTTVPGGRAFDPIMVSNNLFRDEKLTGGAPDFTQHGYPVVYGTMAGIILIASLVAWRKTLRPSSITQF